MWRKQRPQPGAQRREIPRPRCTADQKAMRPLGAEIRALQGGPPKEETHKVQERDKMSRELEDIIISKAETMAYAASLNMKKMRKTPGKRTNYVLS